MRAKLVTFILRFNLGADCALGIQRETLVEYTNATIFHQIQKSGCVQQRHLGTFRNLAHHFCTNVVGATDIYRAIKSHKAELITYFEQAIDWS